MSVMMTDEMIEEIAMRVHHDEYWSSHGIVEFCPNLWFSLYEHQRRKYRLMVRSCLMHYTNLFDRSDEDPDEQPSDEPGENPGGEAGNGVDVLDYI